ncbi:hypothetical protein [Lentimicrobium sp. S6]|uniref:YobI family P-loop NTPase n=2 Tax=Pseudomonadati TaxID=3379134 RepID=UPI0015569690|nr:hypothetical protein [Lentimicrobium sp. S6]NPD47960.1 hypothetical protein [Lentimicrobium sp. S6]
MNNKFMKILKRSIDWLSSYYENHLPKNETDLPYQSLSPTENAEQVEDYLETLDWALNNRKKIKNIAVAGPYGSGKSSVIQTFQNKNKHNKNYHFLNISLATFKEEKPSESNGEKDDILRLIELSILQQLFYHEKDNRIPDSRFKKIKNHKKQYLLGITLGFVVFIISFLYLVFPDFLSKFSIFKLTRDASNIFHILSVLFVFLGSLFAIFKSIRFFKGLSIKKFGISNATIEIDSGISKSILNNHIDEILYFFEVTNYNVIIIEDLDRFEQTDVFTKLREINLLINNSEKIEKDIVFIYAIRDDMFQDKDRTKFFDFMIPIIPVINSSNSNEKLLKIIESNKYDISTDLVEDISLFVDDMRLLYNIMNEYHIYSKKLNSSLNQNKLLSMIVYKNIYPNDFTELSLNKGELFKIIVNKHKYIKEIIKTLNEDISKIESKIEVTESVRLRNLKELRLLYISKIIEKINQSGQAFKSFYIDNRQVNIIQAVEDDVFDTLRNQTSIQYLYQNNIGYRTNLNYDFENIESEVDSKYTYKEREQLVLNDKYLDQLKQDIENIEIEKSNIKKHKLKDLISDKKLIIESPKESQNELLNVLIRNGYIDEEYLDYISIFYEGSLSKNDHQFLINVKTQTEIDFAYPLQKKENLIKRINEFEFEKEYILNYDLFDFLLSSKKYPKKRGTIVNQLKNESDYSIKFIDGFIEHTSNIEVFIKLLCKDWVGIWNFLLNKSNFPKEKLEKYFKLIFEFAEVSSIVKILQNFKSTISDDPDFLIRIKDATKLKEIIEELDLKLNVLNETAPQELLEFVYNGNYYSIKKEIIEFILKFKGLYNQSDFNSKNYSTILLSKLDNLISYIEENINEYLTTTYFNIETNKEEQEDYLVLLLNNDEILPEYKLNIITKTNTIISVVNKIEDLEIVKVLLEESKILAIWKNLIAVYVQSENELIPEIVSFLNVMDNAINLSKKRIETNFPDEETVKGFIISLLLEEEIHNKNYSDILSSVPYIYNSLNFDNLSYEKVELLVTKKKLTTNPANFELLKSNFEKLHILLIENNPTKFIEDIASYELENDDVLDVLISENISVLIKEKVINHFDESFFAVDEELLTQLGKLLLSNDNFDIEETLIKLVIKDSNLPVSSRIRLFNKTSKIYDDNDIYNFLDFIGKPYSTILQTGKRPLLENNNINRELVEILNHKRYISKFRIEKKGIRISTFRKK